MIAPQPPPLPVFISVQTVLGADVPSQRLAPPAVPVRRSVHQDYVICLDCGYTEPMSSGS